MSFESDFYASVDKDMQAWADELLSQRRRENENVRERPPLRVESHFASAPESKFRKVVVKEEEQPPRLVPVSYNCVDGECVDPMDGTGVYSTFAACQAECGMCEGDFEGDYTGPDESLVDVIVGLPYDVTIVYVELTGTATEGNTRIGYGGEGEGSSFVNFSESSGPFIGVTPDVFTWTADPQQPVPAGGFIQIDIGDWTSGDPTGTFHYKIHYTYNCADAP